MKLLKNQVAEKSHYQENTKNRQERLPIEMGSGPEYVSFLMTQVHHQKY